jgi:hypothetical protein
MQYLKFAESLQLDMNNGQALIIKLSTNIELVFVNKDIP